MVTVITEAIGTFLYPLFSIIFSLIMAIESMFYGFAGIGDVYIGGTKITSENGGNFTDTGIVYYLLTSDFAKNLFFSLLTLAIILLVLFAAIACVRNMYSEKPKTWQEIFTVTIKGLMGFVVTPLLCILGAWAGNILLKTINEATNASGTSSLAGELFVVAAYNANRYRLRPTTDSATAAHVATLTQQGDEYKRLTESHPTSEDYADFVDQCYAKKPWTLTGQAWVTVGYELFNINYLLLGIGGVFMLYALGAITFGAIKRMILLLFYFIISPLAHSMAPIDDGAAGKKVRDSFYKNFISVYGAVVGLNLFFSIMPIFQHLDVVTNWAALGGGNATTAEGFFHGIFNLIIVIVGLLTVKELITFVSDLAGGGDLYSTGATTMNSVKGKVKQYGKKVQAAGGAFVGGIKKGVGAHRQRKEDIEAYNKAHGENAFDNLSRKEKKDLKKSGEISAGGVGTMFGSWGKSGLDAGLNLFNTAAGAMTGFELGKTAKETRQKWKKFNQDKIKEGKDNANKTKYKNTMQALKKGDHPLKEEVTKEEEVYIPSGSTMGDDENGGDIRTTRQVVDADASLRKTLKNFQKLLKNAAKYNKDETDLKDARKAIFESKEGKDLFDSLGVVDLKSLTDEQRGSVIDMATKIMDSKQKITAAADAGQKASYDTSMKNLNDYITANIKDFSDGGFEGWVEGIQTNLQNLNVKNVNSENVNSQNATGEFKADSNNGNFSINNTDELADKIGSKLSASEEELVGQIGNRITEMGQNIVSSVKDLTSELKNNTARKIADENAKKNEQANAKQKRSNKNKKGEE